MSRDVVRWSMVHQEPIVLVSNENNSQVLSPSYFGPHYCSLGGSWSAYNITVADPTKGDAAERVIVYDYIYIVYVYVNPIIDLLPIKNQSTSAFNQLILSLYFILLHHHSHNGR